MKVLGIHFETGHDSNVCLMDNGKIVAAIEEERLNRRKRTGEVPFRSIDMILKMTNTDIEDLDCIAFSGAPPYKKLYYCTLERMRRWWDSGFNRWRSGGFLGKYATQSIAKRLYYCIRRDLHYITTYPVSAYLKREKILERLGFSGEVINVNHHLAHASSVFYTSGWDKALVVCMDGWGDNLGTSIWISRDGKLELKFANPDPRSPAHMYDFVTTLLGFKPERAHQGKITGLAAYGNPEKTPNIMNGWYQADRLKLKYSIGFWRMVSEYYGTRRFPPELIGFSREDIAAGVQKLLENRVVSVIKNALRNYPNENICLAGGVFANVKLNQRIREIEGVENVYVCPAMTDSGLSIGAAMYAYVKKAGVIPPRIKDVYFGPSYSDSDIENALQNENLKYNKIRNVESYVADKLSEKKVVGWFQGRLEYGPRALGNRSILADPRDANMKEIINAMVKRRTDFMPFAPSIMEKHASEFFVGYSEDHFTSKFMTMTYDVTPVALAAPAIVHVDHTARPQVVFKADNQRYYRLLQEFEKRTGLPLFLNTSFNIHEEPIVCSPQDAIKSFKSGSVDILVLEDYVIERN